MGNEQYQQMMYKRIFDNLENWDKQDSIPEKDIYFFLHSLKGTAGSIGLDELSMIASDKIEKLKENSDKKWSKVEWKSYLFPFIDGINFYQKNINIQEIEEVVLKSQNSIPSEQEFILIIDNDIEFISYIKNILEKKGFTVIAANNGKRGLELIYDLKPTIVFVDIMLPDTSGFSIIKNLKNIKKDSMIVTVISSNDCRENRVRAYDMGALDFIPKPIDEELLISYINNRLSYKKELENSIIKDELTQIYNRKFMDSQIEKLIKQFERNRESFSIALADLDYFKKVNDTYGHLIGDEVLKGFANLVSSLKREQDFFCRYGGEEFVLIMPQTSVEEAYVLMERLRKAMEKKFFNANENRFQVTFSAGVVESTTKNLHPKKILEEADQALYNAKQSGRNQIVMFDSLEEIVRKNVKIKIIVIDDVYIIRNLITNYFKSWEIGEKFDIDVMAFNDAISFLNSNWYSPDCKYIILLDIVMPKMDGIELLKIIRQDYSTSDVIISMLTGRKEDEYVLQALENGANDYIVKPFDIKEVSNRILSLINRLFI
ncbi:diguanylate cyclase [Rummeliibacillus sp. NPDC094406]|uniref:diguanylate cyclase n=1 Tax=Rummeliibacillus sp. NPDC094406 TaxID=3364511 RepID=UPI0038046292